MGSAQHRRDHVLFSVEESTRVRRYIARVGLRTATERLRVSADSLENARELGRAMKKTHARILEALAREELVP